MSLNHILKDVVPDDEKLDVKFATLQADNLEVDNVTFTDLTVTGQSTLDDVTARNITTSETVLVGNNLVVNNLIRTESGFVQASSVLFKSAPYLNSTTIGPSSILFPVNLVNGMAIFDDANKQNNASFDYVMPYKITLDNYFFLTGAQQYAFIFNVAIFPNMPTAGVYRLTADDNANSGVYFNYIGTRQKLLTHTFGSQSSYTFIGIRQTNGDYIIYG